MQRRLSFYASKRSAEQARCRTIRLHAATSESAAAYEEYFRLYTIRNSEGRYVVALPFNNKKQQLGESRTQAERRLLSSKRKLQRDSDLRQQYHAVLQEYLDIGHLSEIKQSELHYGITPRSNKNLQSDH